MSYEWRKWRPTNVTTKHAGKYHDLFGGGGALLGYVIAHSDGTYEVRSNGPTIAVVDDFEHAKELLIKHVTIEALS